MTKDRIAFLLEQAENELRDGLYFEVKGDDLRIVVEALKLARAASEPGAAPLSQMDYLAGTVEVLTKENERFRNALETIEDVARGEGDIGNLVARRASAALRPETAPAVKSGEQS